MDRTLSENELTEHIKACFENGRPMYRPTLDEVLEMIKAIPSAYKGMTNGEVIKTVFDVDEIQVTENTVIVRVKGSFCAKMQFLLDWWNSPYEPQERSE